MENVDPRLDLVLLVTNLAPPLALLKTRTHLLRLAGVQIGTGSVIGGRLAIEGSVSASEHLRIGESCWINSGCILDTSGPIDIEDNVSFGHDVEIITSTHEIGLPDRRAGTSITKGVTVRQGSWIGARSVLLPGVVVGAGSIVAAGSMVAADVAPSTLVGGVPARVIRALD